MHLADSAETTDRNALIEEHLALVEHIVMRVSSSFPRFIDRGELVSAGTMGLVEAAHRFDPQVGVPFPRFAARRIRGAILDLLRSSDWAPRSVRTMTREVERVEQSLTARNGRRPDDGEVARALGLDPERIKELRGRVQRGIVMTIDQGAGDIQRAPLVQRIFDRGAAIPEEEVEFAEARGFVRDALDRLPERHRMVAIGYYLEGRTFEELAQLLGVTPSRVSQLRGEAVTMMQDGISAQFAEQPAGRPSGRVARRKAQYAASISQNRAWRDRLMAIDEPMSRSLSSGLREAKPA